eukprot:gnl/MRDRNA2_/MRDRNA2_126713_c0_seq1.p1 gnl/MRDRNA2_/MRDRNA2_126713_c0~~gnl/MRDRNA2_/MRDRNA2_126713_c0_seq1.p1  ORF type:complete len:255 (-),score=72.42 gnl/MRDRNA2_/MRDRNA2_126713_c0_seq1:58-822(-)
MLTSTIHILVSVGFAASLSVPDMAADVPVPMKGELGAAVEEASRKQRSVTKATHGIVRTIHEIGTLKDGNPKELSIGAVGQAEVAKLEVTSKSDSCKWMVAVLPPLLLMGFVMCIRQVAEKAKQKDAKDTCLNSFLRVNLIQQALAVSGPENENAPGAEDNAELGQSLLSNADENEDVENDSEVTAALPLLQPARKQEDEDDVDESAKLFASLAESLYQDGLDDDDEEVQVLAADADVPTKADLVDPDDDGHFL